MFLAAFSAPAMGPCSSNAFPPAIKVSASRSAPAPVCSPFRRVLDVAPSPARHRFPVPSACRTFSGPSRFRHETARTGCSPQTAQAAVCPFLPLSVDHGPHALPSPSTPLSPVCAHGPAATSRRPFSVPAAEKETFLSFPVKGVIIFLYYQYVIDCFRKKFSFFPQDTLIPATTKAENFSTLM